MRILAGLLLGGRIQLDLQLRMQKFEMLQSIRKQQPELSNEEIVTLFPGLAEFVKLINTNKTK